MREAIDNELPTSVRLEASTICQLNCAACYMRHNNSIVVGTGYLKFADFKRFVDRHKYIRSIELSNNGEIFLNPELISIIKYACKKDIVLTATNGVNFNTVSEEMLEALVKYKFSHITFSIDGASPEVYSIYRRNGDFNQVIANLKKLNAYKRQYNSAYPRMTWQFVLMEHNETEVIKAKKLAGDLGMDIYFRSTWVYGHKYQNIEMLKKETGLQFLTREDYENNRGACYEYDICYELWNMSAINWDGRLLGCCLIWDDDYAVNVFKVGLKRALSSGYFAYAKKMLRGLAPAPDNPGHIPCARCEHYQNKVKYGSYIDLANIHERLLDNPYANPKIPVVFITDNNYALPTGVAIASLQANRGRDTFYEIFVLTHDLSPFHRRKILSLSSPHSSVQIIDVPNNYHAYNKLHYNNSVFHKFDIIQLFPQYDKVLFLDSDIVVESDLRELFQTELGNAYAAACKDYPHLPCHQIPIENDINTGVLLFNLQKLREERVIAKLINLYQEKRDIFIFGDQDYFNIIFDRRWVLLPISYNLGFSLTFHCPGQLTKHFGLSLKNLKKVMHKPKIIHYAGFPGQKPWIYLHSPYQKNWMKYFRKSPYRNIPLQCKTRSPLDLPWLASIFWKYGKLVGRRFFTKINFPVKKRFHQDSGFFVLPADTGYMLSARVGCPDLIVNILELKDWPVFEPFTVLISDLRQVADLAVLSPARQILLQRLAAKFWPGPLTIVLPKKDTVQDIVSAGLDLARFNMPDNPLSFQILRFTGPLAALPANIYRCLPPQEIDIARDFISSLSSDCFFNSGPIKACEETIVLLQDDGLILLQEGEITRARLARIAPVLSASPDNNTVYRPTKPVYLPGEQPAGIDLAKTGLLAFQERSWQNYAAQEALSPRGSLYEAANNLFGALRRLDQNPDVQCILAEPPRRFGVGGIMLDYFRSLQDSVRQPKTVPPKLLIIVPAYNEAENIAPFIKTVFNNVPAGTELLIIDDNSPDGTARIAERIVSEYPHRLHVLNRPARQGLARAYRAGLAWGLSRAYDAFLQMDADFSHDPAYIAAMLKELPAHDVVVGSRNIAGGGFVRQPILRQVFSRAGNFYARRVLNCPVRDLTSGFTLWTKAALKNIDLDRLISRGYLFQIELKYRAFQLGRSITETPVLFRHRLRGRSKLSAAILLEAFAKIWRLKRSVV